MVSDEFDGPGSADQISWEDLADRLLLIRPLEILTGINTVHGAKDATVVDLHVLDGPEAGTVYRAGYVFPLVLQNQIKGNVASGRFNLGRLGKGQPKPGQKPPWKLNDPTEDDKVLARRYLASDHYKANGAASTPASASSDPWGAAPAAFSGAGDEPPF